MAGKSKKNWQPQVLTANLLVGGDVVYWREDDTWAQELKDAFVFDTDVKVEAALASAQTAVEARKILDPYLFTVSIDDGVIHASSVREQIRAAGPTVRLDLGKQAA